MMANVKRDRSTIDGLAKQVGIATRTLHGWIARGCPRDSADAVREWRAANMLPRHRIGIRSQLWDQERQARIRGNYKVPGAQI